MKFIDTIIHGADEVGETDNDFLIEGEIELPPLFKQNDVRYEYSQGSTPHCTLYSSFGALSDLKDYNLTATDINEIVQMSVERGKPIDKGWSTQLGVKCVCDRWNAKHPEDKAIYFRIDLLSNNFAQVLKAGYTVVVTFKGNSDYSNDHYQDGVIDGTAFTPSTRGHATSCLYLEDNKVYIKDSYKGRKRKGGKDDNYYQLKDIVGLIKSGCYYGVGYVIMSENAIKPNIDDLKRLKAFEIDINTAIELNSKLWHLTNDESYKAHLEEMNNVNRSKLLDITTEKNRLV